MKRWGALALVMVLATATGAAARHRGGAGKSFFGGVRFPGRHGGTSFQLGFGSRFHSRGFHSTFWGQPAYGYAGYPAYNAFPGFGYFPGFTNFGFGYGYPFPLFSYAPSDVFMPFWNNAWGVSRYSLPPVVNQPSYIELPPRIVTVGSDFGYYPRVTDGAARLERGGERYYLEPRAPAPVRERPATLNESFRDKVRVETADTDQYLVRWTGDPSELVALELTALDADRKVVMRRLIKAAPFRGLLNTGGKTITVTLSIDVKDGPTVTLEYPLERFRELAND